MRRTHLEEKAKEFIVTDAETEELNVPTAEDALQGAADIITEETH